MENALCEFLKLSPDFIISVINKTKTLLLLPLGFPVAFVVLDSYFFSFRICMTKKETFMVNHIEEIH